MTPEALSTKAMTQEVQRPPVGAGCTSPCDQNLLMASQEDVCRMCICPRVEISGKHNANQKTLAVNLKPDLKNDELDTFEHASIFPRGASTQRLHIYYH